MICLTDMRLPINLYLTILSIVCSSGALGITMRYVGGLEQTGVPFYIDEITTGSSLKILEIYASETGYNQAVIARILLNGETTFRILTIIQDSSIQQIETGSYEVIEENGKKKIRMV